ncbi:hypothetical protein SDJN02_12228, partial [Cucurbita argyrosperma subsp. argyrosperma]
KNPFALKTAFDFSFSFSFILSLLLHGIVFFFPFRLMYSV